MSLEELADDDKDSGSEEGAPAWMATFSDMATLLLTFFVLLLSFANMDIENFKVALGSVKEAFGVQHRAMGDFEAMSTSPIELSDQQSAESVSEDDESNEFNEVKEYIKRHKLQKAITVSKDPRGIVLRINDLVLFDTGSDELKLDAFRVLDVVGELVGFSTGELAIQGHTDDRPIHTARFPSNWELSTARSTAVLRYLMKEANLSPARVHVAGYADARPVTNDKTEEGRAKNRRVEFVFMRPVDKDGNKRRIFRLPFSKAGNP